MNKNFDFQMCLWAHMYETQFAKSIQQIRYLVCLKLYKLFVIFVLWKPLDCEFKNILTLLTTSHFHFVAKLLEQCSPRSLIHQSSWPCTVLCWWSLHYKMQITNLFQKCLVHNIIMTHLVLPFHTETTTNIIFPNVTKTVYQRQVSNLSKH